MVLYVGRVVGKLFDKPRDVGGRNPTAQQPLPQIIQRIRHGMALPAPGDGSIEPGPVL